MIYDIPSIEHIEHNEAISGQAGEISSTKVLMVRDGWCSLRRSHHPDSYRGWLGIWCQQLGQKRSPVDGE